MSGDKESLPVVSEGGPASRFGDVVDKSASPKVRVTGDGSIQIDLGEWGNSDGYFAAHLTIKKSRIGRIIRKAVDSARLSTSLGAGAIVVRVERQAKNRKGKPS